MGGNDKKVLIIVVSLIFVAAIFGVLNSFIGNTVFDVIDIGQGDDPDGVGGGEDCESNEDCIGGEICFIDC